MKSGCAGGYGFAPRPEQSRESFSSFQETGKIFSPEMPFYSKFGNMCLPLMGGWMGGGGGVPNLVFNKKCRAYS